MKKLLIIALCIFYLTGCSKKDVEPENYLIAKIDGKAWDGNVVNSANTNVAATIAQNLVIIAAERDEDNVRSSLGIIFPESSIVGQQIEFNSQQKIVLVYANGSKDGYLIDVNNGESGKLVVNNLDKENGIVKGTFSGTAVHSKNGSKLVISDGRFRSKIYQGTITTNPPGKK